MKKTLMTTAFFAVCLSIFAQTPIDETFKRVKESKTPVIMAHKLAPKAGYAENSLATLRYNLKNHPELLQEVDVRVTKDGVAVLNHDEKIDRTTNGSGRIAEMTFADLQKFKLKDNHGEVISQSIPKLSDFLTILKRGNGVTMLDMKPGTDPKIMMDIVEQTKTSGNIIVICYSLDDAIDVQRKYPNTPVAINSAYVFSNSNFGKLAQDKVIALAPNELQADGYYQLISSKNIPISFSTFGNIDKSKDAQQVYGKALEAGATIICSDSIKSLSEVIARGGKKRSSANNTLYTASTRQEISSIMTNAKQSPNYYISVAHRAKISGADAFPENSLSVINNSISQGVPVLEIDLKISSDGVVYLMHDDYLQRTTNFLDVYPGVGTGQDSYGKCTNYTWDQVKNLLLTRADFTYTTEKIPMFSEVVSHVKNNTQAILNLDINSDAVFQAAWEIVLTLDAFDVVIFKTRGMSLPDFQTNFYNTLSAQNKAKLMLFPIISANIPNLVQYYNTWEASSIPKGYEVSFRNNVSETDLQLLAVVNGIRTTDRVRVHAFSTMPDNYKGRYKGNVNINQCCNNAFDRRGDWQFLLDPTGTNTTSGVNGSIITDDPILLDAYFNSIGRLVK